MAESYNVVIFDSVRVVLKLLAVRMMHLQGGAFNYLDDDETQCH
jgi:hypothetical protein